MMEEYWSMIVDQMFAGGWAHNLIAGAEIETMEVIDDYGVSAVWKYDKVNQKITLEEA